MERHIAIIPARRGSQSIKNKNLITLNGKSLIRLTLESAMEAQIFSRIVITTDYPRYKVGIDGLDSNSFTKILYIRRPDDLCKNDSLMVDVVKQALDRTDGQYTWVWLLQPTSPFRKKIDYKIIKGALETGEYESAISFCPSKDNQSRLYTIREGVAHGSQSCNFKNKQELKTNWTRSGNYYVFKESGLKEQNSFQIKPYFCYFMGNVKPDDMTQGAHKLSRMLGSNIDDKEDLEIVKNYVRRGDIVV